QNRIERTATQPPLDARGTRTHTRTPSSTYIRGGSSIRHEYSAQLGLSSYELDDFGRIQNRQAEALEDYLALTETRRSTQI
ncbi:transporter, partial [Pseudomonas syringae pv. tagetis]